MGRSICLFVVRHGEREDEVIDRRHYRKMTQRERLDPSLTPRGFSQAQAAFDRLGVAISGNFRRVAIFSSPLRRALGTATMISASSCAATMESPSFVLPTNDGPENKQQTKHLPIVVWDSLCDCAAQVKRLGGHRNAIRTGFLHCAAKQPNSDDKTTGKLHQTLIEMHQLADTGLGHAPDESCPFQLWKLGDQDALVPMTTPIRFFGNKNSPVEYSDPANVATSSLTISHGESPIDQVVRMAMDGGCDACVVVSHREEIRELYKYRCKYQLGRRSLPYCCVGSFEVAEEDTESSSLPSLLWTMHEVAPFDDMTPDAVRSMLSGQENKLGKTFTLEIPTPTSLSCHVALVLNDATLPFLDMESCVLSLEAAPPPPSTGIVAAELAIQKGRGEWHDCLYAQDHPFALVVGTAVVKLKEDASLQEKQIWILPSQQPELPCPPKVIRIIIRE